MKPPSEGRLDSIKRRPTRVPTHLRPSTPKPFFFAALTQARGLSRDELKYLTVSKELIIADDARTIANAQEIFDTYLASSSREDDDAVLAPPLERTLQTMASAACKPSPSAVTEVTCQKKGLFSLRHSFLLPMSFLQRIFLPSIIASHSSHMYLVPYLCLITNI